MSSEAFEINRYIPCQLALLSQCVIRSLASALQEQFDITLPEWKVLATVAHKPGMSAVLVAQHAQMDTVAVSRAVTKLLDCELIQRQTDSVDRRCSVLTLLPKGEEMCEAVAPLVAELEQELFNDLNEDLRRSFQEAVEALAPKAEMMIDRYVMPANRRPAQTYVSSGIGVVERYKPRFPAIMIGLKLDRTTG